MANVAHMDSPGKQKAVEIASGPVPRRAMHTVRVQQRLKSVKTHPVPTIYHVKSGNVVVPSQ
jgi:hypothetical protein